MKKFLCICLLLCFVFVPCRANAKQPKEDVSAFVQNHQYTREATCVTFGKYCVVGVRTKGILLSSDCKNYFEDIISGIKRIAPQYTHVYVTNNLQEVIVIKEVDKKIKEGVDNVQILSYLQQKYPKTIDKILLHANI